MRVGERGESARERDDSGRMRGESGRGSRVSLFVSLKLSPSQEICVFILSLVRDIRNKIQILEQENHILF